jgi:uncharacterized protein (DUF433 family)
MTLATLPQIEIDDQGRPWIAGTGTKVIVVVMETLKDQTPAQIQQGFPHLSLSQIHAALAYYYDHKPELDAEIARGVAEAEALRARAISSGGQPSREELEDRGRRRQGPSPDDLDLHGSQRARCRRLRAARPRD